MSDHSGNIKFEDFDRLLWKLAHRFYKRVPDCFRGSVDVEDLYNVGASQFSYALTKFHERVGKKQPFPKLLTYSVVHRLSDEIRGMNAKKRFATVTSIDDDEEFVVLPVLPQNRPLADKRVRRFYELASDDLREVLDLHIFGGKSPDTSSLVSFRRFSDEVQWLAERTEVTVEDFLVLLR